jgi:hypothetical protein
MRPIETIPEMEGGGIKNYDGGEFKWYILRATYAQYSKKLYYNKKVEKIKWAQETCSLFFMFLLATLKKPIKYQDLKHENFMFHQQEIIQNTQF